METRYVVVNLDNNKQLLKRGAELAKYQSYNSIEDINK